MKEKFLILKYNNGVKAKEQILLFLSVQQKIQLMLNLHF